MDKNKPSFFNIFHQYSLAQQLFDLVWFVSSDTKSLNRYYNPY